jgi:hypothetical protein
MHLLVDRLVGVVFIAAPLVLGFVGLDALYYYLNGAAVLLVTLALNSPQGDQGAADETLMRPTQESASGGIPDVPVNR